MAKALERLFTVEDWLDYAGEGDTRYELVDGVIVAMNPAKTWHAAIANQLGLICANALRGRFPCRALQAPGLVIRRTPKAKGYIPDLVVTCEPIGDNPATVAEPRLVVEILSPSTDRLDKRTKRDDYRGLPSVEEVWLVHSQRREVVQSVRRDDGSWHQPGPFTGSDSFSSPVLAATVALDEIYRFTLLAGTDHDDD